MRNPIYNYHFGGSSLSDNRMLEEGILASITADSLELPKSESSNELSIDITHPSIKDIPMWIALSTALLAIEQDDDDDDDDYHDPDDDEILDTMFPDEDDDFWNDNYDID